MNAKRWLTINKIWRAIVILSLILTMSTFPQTSVRAQTSATTLMEAYGPGQSTVPAGTSTNDAYNHQVVYFNYSGGIVTLTMCPDQACTWAVDDAIRLYITHPDQSQESPDDFVSMTQDQEAVVITDLFDVGTNTVDVWLVDKMGPVYSMPRTIYLVESTESLPEAELNVESIPSELNANPNVDFSHDPVNTLTGGYTYVHTDVTVAGRGPTPAFVRSYDSNDTRTGILGSGWTHNYDMHLASPSEQSDDIFVVDAQGRGNYFTYDQGNYIPPSGITNVLVKNGDGTYKLTAKDQTSWVYSETGLLLRIIDRYGNQSMLSYNDNDQLTSVSDPAGRGSLTFSYNGSGLLESVTDWASREVSYTYDANGRLETVTDRNGETTTYAYDSTSSRLTTITDARSNVAVTNTYTDGKVATQKDALGLITNEQTTFSFVINQDDTKTTTVTYPATSFDPNWDYVELYNYDIEDKLTSKVSKPVASSSEWITETYGYDGNGLRISFTDGRGNTTNFCYDVDYAGDAISGSFGNLTRVIVPPPTSGANRPVNLYTYDGNNNLVQEIPPLGVGSGTSVDCTTDLSSSIDYDYATDYTYDEGTSTLLESVSRYYTDPDLGSITSTITYEYDDSANPGMVTQMIPPRGNEGENPDTSYATTYEYGVSGTQAGMLITTTAPLSTIMSYEYDSVGRLISMVDPKGNEEGATPSDHTWEYDYDDEDRLTFVTTPAPEAEGDSLVTEYQYDEVGNRVARIDANGQVTLFVYDERDNLEEVHQSPDAWTDPESPPANVIVAEYEYDNLGNLVSVVRAKDDNNDERATGYAYDGLGRLRTETNYPSWPTTTPAIVITYTYDTDSNVQTRIDALTQTTTYEYDNLNRLTYKDYSNNQTTMDIEYEYDANGNRTNMDNYIADISYEYDEMNRLLVVETFVLPLLETNIVEYRYDSNGNRTKLIYPDDTTVEYEYDCADRLTTVTDWDDRTSTYDYFIDGTVERLTHFNGVTTDYSYDNANRLTRIWHMYDDDTFARYTYSLDAIGNRISVEDIELTDEAEPLDEDRIAVIDYYYDGMSRLITEDRDIQGSLSDETLDYTYDPVGNRITQSFTDWSGTDETEFTYDKMDRIDEADGDYDEAYTFDNNGNLTYRTTDAFNKDWYWFDQENRIYASKHDNYYTYYYSSDADGNRMYIRRKYSIFTTLINKYVYDVNRGLPVLLEDKENKYVYGLGLLYTVVDDEPYFYHNDGVGSMRFMTYYDEGDPPEVEAHQDYYDAFGIEKGSSSYFEQPYKFAGEQKDSDDYWNMPPSDYYYLRARYYDPITARFASRDPYAGDTTRPLSLNRYTYVENNPCSKTDPSGLSSSKVMCDEPFEGPIARGLVEAQLAHEKEYYDTLVSSSTPYNALRGFGTMVRQALPLGLGYSERVRKLLESMEFGCIEYGGTQWDLSAYGNIIYGYQMKRLGFTLEESLKIANAEQGASHWPPLQPDPWDDAQQIRLGFQYGN